MFDAVLIALFAGAFFAGGWYLKGRFGAKVAADVATVQDVAKKL
jgi:hypothetical protein